MGLMQGVEYDFVDVLGCLDIRLVHGNAGTPPVVIPLNIPEPAALMLWTAAAGIMTARRCKAAAA